MNGLLRDKAAAFAYSRRPDMLFNFGAALSVIAVVYGGLRLVSERNAAIIPSGAWGVLFGLVLMLPAFVLAVGRIRKPALALEGWFLALLLVLVSDAPTRWPTCFHGGLGLEHLALAGAIGVFCLPRLGARAGLLFWILGSLAGYWGIREATQGTLVLADDHAAFLYRLEQLKNNFPDIPFYNPQWNGGVEAREFFPSGVLNVFLILWPLIAFIDLTGYYTELIAVLLFVVCPACTYLALRLLNLRAPLAPVLSLFPTILWYRYELFYGTLGYITSTALAPLVMALLVRIAEAGSRASWLLCAALVLALSLLFLWTPAVFIVMPAVAVLSLSLLRFAVAKRGVVTVFSMLLLNLPWVLIFLEASQVLQFISAPQTGEGPAPYPEVRELFGHLRYALRTCTPAIVVLTAPGLIILRRERPLVAVVFTVSIGSLFAAGLLFSPIKPRLELERLTVAALYLSVIPTAVALRAVSEKAALKSGFRRLICGFGVGSVLLTPAVLYVFSANRTIEPYAANSEELLVLAAAIREHHGGGRVAFSGYVQHQLGGVHVAPLALFTGVPLFASRYQHDRWEHVDWIPAEFRKEHDAGIEKFLDFYNITSIVVIEPEWGPWLAARPDRFQLVWESPKAKIFERLSGPRSWFIEGAGEVLDQSGSELRLRLDTPSAIIRFNWLSFLEVEGCRSINPAEVYPGVSLIRLDGCGSAVRVRARSAIKRILG